MHRGSLRRLGLDQLALGQLHWSVAKYAPPLERALWDGLAAIYDEVRCLCGFGLNIGNLITKANARCMHMHRAFVNSDSTHLNVKGVLQKFDPSAPSAICWLWAHWPRPESVLKIYSVCRCRVW